MAYEVTATRKRPKDFEHLVGQEFVVSTLTNSLKSGMIAHAYLFAGPRGVGKTSAARVLAKALNCPGGPGSDGCFDWQGADEIAKGRSIDVIEIDGASNTSVNDIRTIKDEVLFPPQSSRYKIYIIDEVHMLSNSAFNALLKTIEEPPPYIIFIFATTELHKVPATIRSRCQQFVFKLIPLDLVRERLAEAAIDLGIKADVEALNWIAKESTGSLRDAYTLFDQVVAFSQGHISLEKIREKLGLVGLDQINQMVGHMVDSQTAALIECYHQILANGVSVEQVVMDLAEYFRGMLLFKSGVTRETLIGYHPSRFHQKAISTFTRVQLERILHLLLMAYRDQRYSMDPRYDTELLLCRLSRVGLYQEPEEILRQLGSLPAPASQREPQETGPAEVEKKKHELTVTESGIQKTFQGDQHGQAQTENRHEVPPHQPIVNSVPKPIESGNDNSVCDLSLEHKRDFMLAVREHSLALAGSFDHVVLWEKRGSVLTLKCQNSFAIRALIDERSRLNEIGTRVLPFLTEIRVEAIEGARSKQEPVQNNFDPEAEKIRDIFRGEYT